MVDQVYRPRKPQLSPLWKCLCRHFYDFVQAYPEAYEKKYGFLKPAVEEVVDKYLECGDLSKGFARLHCDKCNKDYLLAFSCKGRRFFAAGTGPSSLKSLHCAASICTSNEYN